MSPRMSLLMPLIFSPRDPAATPPFTSLLSLSTENCLSIYLFHVMWHTNNAKASRANCSVSRGVTKGSNRSRPLVGMTSTTPVARPRGTISFIPNYPLPKVPQRPPSKSNKRETLADIAERIPLGIMRNFFDFPLRTAAEVSTCIVLTCICRMLYPKKMANNLCATQGFIYCCFLGGKGKQAY